MDNDYLFRILIPLLEKVGFVEFTSIVNNGSKVDIKLSSIAPYRCAISVTGDKSFTVYTNPVDLCSMLWYLLSTRGYVHLVRDIKAMNNYEVSVSATWDAIEKLQEDNDGNHS